MVCMRTHRKYVTIQEASFGRCYAVGMTTNVSWSFINSFYVHRKRHSFITTSFVSSTLSLFFWPVCLVISNERKHDVTSQVIQMFKQQQSDNHNRNARILTTLLKEKSSKSRNKGNFTIFVHVFLATIGIL